LIRVEDRWFATRASQRLFQSPHAKGAVHGVADFPSENGPAMPMQLCFRPPEEEVASRMAGAERRQSMTATM
jgi:hypothetical protein